MAVRGLGCPVRSTLTALQKGDAPQAAALIEKLPAKSSWPMRPMTPMTCVKPSPPRGRSSILMPSTHRVDIGKIGRAGQFLINVFEIGLGAFPHARQRLDFGRDDPPGCPTTNNIFASNGQFCAKRLSLWGGSHTLTDSARRPIQSSPRNVRAAGSVRVIAKRSARPCAHALKCSPMRKPEWSAL
jgi:hypothetical protein